MAKRNRTPGLVKRGNVYWADFRYKGERLCSTLGTGDRQFAEEKLLQRKARLARGEDPDLLNNDLLLDELKADYLRYLRQVAKPRTIERYEFNLAAILPHMPRRISKLTTQTILDYRQRRLAEVCPRTVNSDVDTLSRMLNWAVAHQQIKRNPIKGIKPLRHDRPKQRRALDDGEVHRLLEHCPEHWRDAWYTFLVTGMRVGELIELRFSDVDWDSRELMIHRAITKNHRPRRVPIDRALWELLCQRRETRGEHDYVFTNIRGGPLRRASLYRCFIRCCKRAGIKVVDDKGHERKHVDIHSLRGTFATNLIVNRTDPKSVQELLGHATLAMTMNLYAKVNVGTKREAIGRLSYGAGPEGPAVIKLPSSG